MDVFEGEGLRQILGVLVVFGLLAAAVWKLRTGSPRAWVARAQRIDRLEAAGRLMLTPQHMVHVVRLDGRELVVATHPQGCCLLAEQPAAKGAHS
jgi:flagellar biogenesis protein FliO